MPRRLPSLLFIGLFLVLAVSGCGGVADEPGAPVPSEVAPSPLAANASPTSSPLPPTEAPMPTLAVTATETAPVAETATAIPAVTPSPLLPSATTTPAPLPTSTLLPSPTPTLTPQPANTMPPTVAPTVTPEPLLAVDPAAIRLELQPVVGGLERPVGIANAGDGSGRLFLLEQVGRIRIVRDGALVAAPFLDLTSQVGSRGNEQGLLGLAFHPNYAENGTFFVNYTGLQGDTVVERFSVTADPDRADPGSGTVLLTIGQPAGNHNGGHLAFGPDGYLYIGTGDGGGAGDQYGNGQNGQTLLGAMLRLDVDGDQPYAVPAANPFVGDPAVRDEIWAIGLRNPWRYSFDRLTGDLYIADVGQNQYEEINFQPASGPGGQNYGWPIMEGQHCFPRDRDCDQTGLVLPVAEYDHAQGCSVTGGYVYRGQAFPMLAGIYLFGDYCSGRIWGLAAGQPGDWQLAEMAGTGLRLSSFGEDETGELYALDMGGGQLFRILARPK